MLCHHEECNDVVCLPVRQGDLDFELSEEIATPPEADRNDKILIWRKKQ